jgi:hypothetical protein
MSWIGHVACVEENRSAYMFFLGKYCHVLPGKRRHRWEDRVIIDVGEYDRGMNWIRPAQDRDQ